MICAAWSGWRTLILRLVSHLQAERREVADGRDLAGQHRVDGRVVRLRVVLEVNALASTGDARLHDEVLVHPLGPVRRERGGELGQRHQASIAASRTRASLSASRPLFQKRLRLRRTYQLESASTKATSFCVAP